jgi:hypothetical protein
MILHPLTSKAPKQGDIVVCFNNTDVKNASASIGLIEEIGSDFILVGPFGALAGEDEDMGFTSIPVEDAQQRVSYPELEVGDRLLHRGRLACVVETQKHDWHVKIEYADPQGGEFYGNVIWMDLQPTLVTLRQT